MTCLSFLLIKFGDCGTTQSITIDTSILASIMNTVEQDAKNTINTGIYNTNILNYTNNGIAICPGDWSISQTNVVSNVVVNTFTSEQVSEISDKMVDKIVDELDAEQKRGLLNFLNEAFSSGLKNMEDVTNKIQEEVKNSISQAQLNSIWDTNTNSNVLNVTNNFLIEGGQCAVTQSNAANVRVTNYATELQTTLSNNTFLNDIATYAKAGQTSGILSWKWVILGIVILIAVIIIGVVLYFTFGGKSTPKAKQSPLEREMIEECLLTARRKFQEEGIPINRETLRPAVEECVLRKREERGRGEERPRGEEGERRYEEGPREEYRGEGRYSERPREEYGGEYRGEYGGEEGRAYE